MGDPVSMWFQGETGDHLFAECPGLKRLVPPSPAVFSQIDPEGGDICGWCLRVWRARNRPAGAPPGKAT